jgi:hypothetical protein
VPRFETRSLVGHDGGKGPIRNRCRAQQRETSVLTECERDECVAGKAGYQHISTRRIEAYVTRLYAERKGTALHLTQRSTWLQSEDGYIWSPHA